MQAVSDEALVSDSEASSHASWIGSESLRDEAFVDGDCETGRRDCKPPSGQPSGGDFAAQPQQSPQEDEAGTVNTGRRRMRRRS